jgi:hypothetical protein
MIVYSFDCAVKNLGFCCIEINEKWKEDLPNIILTVTNMYVGDDTLTIENIKNVLDNVDKFISNILVIKYMNIFNLSPNVKQSEWIFSEIVVRLKYLLYCLEKQLPRPDHVLIEHQMNINDKSRGISKYIEEYYVPIDSESGKIEYALTSYPLVFTESPKNEKIIQIHNISPGAKNKYQTDPIKGGYHNFIKDFKKNYDINKKHSIYNFVYFVKVFNTLNTLDVTSVKHKLDDVADAFMQCLAWGKSQHLF